MKSILIGFFCLSCVSFASAQDFNRSTYIPKVSDYTMYQSRIEYKWPHLYYVPKYIGLIGGIQGFREFAYEGGLVLNLINLEEAVGGVVGGTLMYKKGFRNNIETYSAEVGVYLPICFGVNFNYNTQNDLSTFGVKPFIGVSVFNIQFLYGFNFYSKKTQINGLRHGHVELRYVLPLIPFGKEKNKKVPVPTDYPNDRIDNRIRLR